MKNILRKMLSKTSSLFLFKKRNNSQISKQAGFKKCFFRYCCKNNLQIGNSKFLNCRFNIYGTGNTFIVGDGCLFNDVDFYISDGSAIIIKSNTRIFGHTHIASCEGNKVEIGDDCLISSDVNIRNTDSHSIVDLNGIRINPGKDIIIGNHVWICNNVNILKGAQISSNSVVGNSSLVTKKFEEENVIICGAPAFIKKRNVNWVDKKLP